MRRLFITIVQLSIIGLTPPYDRFGGEPWLLSGEWLRARQGDLGMYCTLMNESVETLISQAMQLPPDQRLTLAHRILSSVEPEGSSEIGDAWDREIRERMSRYDAGGIRSVPASEVFEDLDRRLRR